MTEVLKLEAQAREKAGKGASRAQRRAGRVPAVIYGNKEAAVGIHVEEKILVKALQAGGFLKKIVEIELDGATVRVQPREVQFHPVTDRPIHVDFLRA